MAAANLVIGNGVSNQTISVSDTTPMSQRAQDAATAINAVFPSTPTFKGICRTTSRHLVRQRAGSFNPVPRAGRDVGCWPAVTLSTSFRVGAIVPDRRWPSSVAILYR